MEGLVKKKKKVCVCGGGKPFPEAWKPIMMEERLWGRVWDNRNSQVTF